MTRSIQIVRRKQRALECRKVCRKPYQMANKFVQSAMWGIQQQNQGNCAKTCTADTVMCFVLLCCHLLCCSADDNR